MGARTHTTHTHTTLPFFRVQAWSQCLPGDTVPSAPPKWAPERTINRHKVAFILFNLLKLLIWFLKHRERSRSITSSAKRSTHCSISIYCKNVSCMIKKGTIIIYRSQEVTKVIKRNCEFGLVRLLHGLWPLQPDWFLFWYQTLKLLLDGFLVPDVQHFSLYESVTAKPMLALKGFSSSGM